VSPLRFIAGLFGSLGLLMLPWAIAVQRQSGIKQSRRRARGIAQALRDHGYLYGIFAFLLALMMAVLSASSRDGALLGAGFCLILSLALTGRVLQNVTGRTGNMHSHTQWQSRRVRTHAHEKPQQSEQMSADPRLHGTHPNGWWDVLGVSSLAPLSEIRSSYLARIKECHPDRVAGLSDEIVELAERRTKELNAAFEAAKASFCSLEELRSDCDHKSKYSH
jgi:hypothetical protein